MGPEDEAWAVWNRACSEAPGQGEGDLHLWVLIHVHGVTMNGGTSHSARIRTAEAFERAARACEYLELTDLAALLREIPRAPITPGREQRLNAEYFALARDDQLFAAFRRKVGIYARGLRVDIGPYLPGDASIRARRRVAQALELCLLWMPLLPFSSPAEVHEADEVHEGGRGRWALSWTDTPSSQRNPERGRPPSGG